MYFKIEYNKKKELNDEYEFHKFFSLCDDSNIFPIRNINLNKIQLNKNNIYQLYVYRFIAGDMEHFESYQNWILLENDINYYNDGNIQSFQIYCLETKRHLDIEMESGIMWYYSEEEYYDEKYFDLLTGKIILLDYDNISLYFEVINKLKNKLNNDTAEIIGQYLINSNISRYIENKNNSKFKS